MLFLQKKTVYHQYGVLVDNEYAKNAESDWFTIQTAQKHIYLHICPKESFRNYTHTKKLRQKRNSVFQLYYLLLATTQYKRRHKTTAQQEETIIYRG